MSSTMAPAAARSRPSVTSSTAERVRSGLPGASSTDESWVRLATLRRSGSATEPDDADEPDVAFEQRVDRLRGRVRDELDLVGPDLGHDALAPPRPHPAATPCDVSWLVGTTACATTASRSRSNAIDLVNVPPTSTPTRTPIRIAGGHALLADAARAR